VLLLVLALTTWFAGIPAGLPPWLPATALAALLVGSAPRPRLRAPHAATLVCLALALAYRAPALAYPWGFVNKDGAYGAFVALHLLQGVRPAPVFTEGANYQGTLKGHLAALLALVTGGQDLSLLMLVASLLLYLVIIAATMALARRLGGGRAALFAGLYLALSPRFLTVFSLNCVGQYVEVLALGGVAVAWLARLQDDGLHGVAARHAYLGIGLLLGLAFWQQPVALSYALVCGPVLALRAVTRRDPWVVLAALGALVGALPVLLWNLANAWATGDIIGRNADHVTGQAESFLALLSQTYSISLPRLAGLSPGHPWAALPGLRAAVGAVVPLALAGYLWVQRSTLRLAPGAGWLTPLLTLCCLGMFWAVAAGRVLTRPRYLLPVLAASAVHLGVCAAWGWGRARWATLAGATALLALNAAGTLPRLLASGEIAASYATLVQSLQQKGIRTGYADFSVSAPVTMFTREAIVLSPALGPTPAYQSPLHEERVRRLGPDAFVLLPGEDPEPFAQALRDRGVTFQLDRFPLPVFYRLSARVSVEDLREARGNEASRVPAGDD